MVKVGKGVDSKLIGRRRKKTRDTPVEVFSSNLSSLGSSKVFKKFAGPSGHIVTLNRSSSLSPPSFHPFSHHLPENYAS